MAAVTTIPHVAAASQTVASGFTLELDSHTDTSVLGSNCYVFEKTEPERTVSVQGYDPSLGVQPNKPIVNGAFAYDDPRDGTVYILIVNQELGELNFISNLDLK